MTMRKYSLQLVKSQPIVKLKRKNINYLKSLLPKDALNYFSPHKYGRNYGLSIVCPHCEERPPKEIPPWNRWRWLAVHITVHKAKK